MSTVILYVDDQPELPEGLEESLERDGYELLHTANPETAVRLAEEREPALVLMELDLGGCDGLDLMEGIRACGADAAGLPVLVLSRAPRSSGLYGEAIALGVTNFLTKPVLASQLLSAIHEIAPPLPKAPEPEPAAQTAAPGLAGDLSETPLLELLARLRRRAASGVLIASRGRVKVATQLRNGSPAAVSSNRRRAYPDDANETGSDEEVAASIGRRAEAELGMAFGWTDGSYRFIESKRLKAELALALARDPASVILHCVMTSLPVGLVRDRLRKRASLYASVSQQEDVRIEEAGLEAEQERQLAELGGEATLGQILDSGAFEERLLYGLWVAGWLELHAAPTLTLLEELGGDADESALQREAPAEGPEALAQTLRSLAQRVLAVDDFEALDIPTFAPDGQVRSAYERILAEIPEAALTSSDPELHARATRIRPRVEAAYEHLKDAETRRAHALLRQEEEQDRDARTSAPRALEAERWFRKGGALLEGKHYTEAAEAFGMASHLDPEEGEYLSNLGYALYLSNPGQEVVRKEAMEHIANGIKRSPDRELPYVYLARILREKGETETARKVLRRALRIKPGCHPALRELRLLEMRERKGKGILNRLLRR